MKIQLLITSKGISLTQTCLQHAAEPADSTRYFRNETAACTDTIRSKFFFIFNVETHKGTPTEMFRPAIARKHLVFRIDLRNCHYRKLVQGKWLSRGNIETATLEYILGSFAFKGFSPVGSCLLHNSLRCLITISIGFTNKIHTYQ